MKSQLVCLLWYLKSSYLGYLGKNLNITESLTTTVLLKKYIFKFNHWRKQIVRK